MRRRSGLSWGRSAREYGASAGVAGTESVQTVSAAVDETPRRGEVVLLEGLADGWFLVGEKDGEKLGGDLELAGELRMMDEVVPGALRVVGVVGAAGELDEASAAEAGAIGRALVAQIGAAVVEVERVTAG